jgi:hypothetical protein
MGFTMIVPGVRTQNVVFRCAQYYFQEERMENLDNLNIVMMIAGWINYVFWIGVNAAVILSAIVGWKRNRIGGFIFILISGCLSLALHLPSIFFKGFYALQRYTPAEYGNIMSVYSSIDTFAMPLIAVLLLVGLFQIALKKDKTPVN